MSRSPEESSTTTPESPKRSTYASIQNPIQSSLSSHYSSLRNTSNVSVSNSGDKNSLGLVPTHSGSSTASATTPPATHLPPVMSSSPSSHSKLVQIVLNTISKSSDSESNTSSSENPQNRIMKLMRRSSSSTSDGKASLIDDHVTPQSPRTPIITHNDDPSGSNVSFDMDSYQGFQTITKKVIPEVFITSGLPLLRVTHKKRTRRYFKIDFEKLLLTWQKNDSTKLSSMSIDKIKSIRAARDAANYREELHISKEYETLWCSIIYIDHKHKLKGLHVIADTQPEFSVFVKTMTLLMNYRKNLIKNFLAGIDDYKDLVVDDTKDKKLLSFQDILKYAKRLHINVNDTYLRRIFDQVDVDHNSFLDFEEFKEFMKIFKRRRDVETIFSVICECSEMTDVKLYYSNFKEFVLETQRESFGENTINNLFEKFAKKNKTERNEPLYMTVDDFNAFLLSLPYLRTTESPDYSRPLTDYFISSSHNTYLLGRQVIGESSIENYIKVLQRGCRCVEIDIWDGDMGPVVSHGRTFTSSVDLPSVCQVIKKHAFITSSFPLIISLEVHCNYENQLKIRAIMIDTFGDMLVMEPLVDDGTGPGTFLGKLPSPQHLKHKVVLKVKKTSAFTNDSSGTDTSFSEDTTNTSTSSSSSKMSIRRKAKSSSKISDELASLGVYLQGLKFRNFSLPESKTVNHCFSFNEKTINSMLKDPIKQQSIDKHNRRYLMRMYPSQFRLNSSNFIPLKYWAIGTQMVATNWQTYDLGQQINEAMFEIDNRIGYILKPKHLLRPLRKELDSQLFSARRKRVSYCFEIISAHQLPKPKESAKSDDLLNPYVIVEVIGVDTTFGVHRTTAIEGNGFNPIWNFKACGVIEVDEDLVFVRFLVKSGDAILGLLVAKLDYLNQGFRYLPLNDVKGEELIYSCLFVKVGVVVEEVVR